MSAARNDLVAECTDVHFASTPPRNEGLKISQLRESNFETPVDPPHDFRFGQGPVDMNTPFGFM